MRELNDYFLTTNVKGVSNIQAYINILPDVKVSDAETVESWCLQASDNTNSNPILDNLVSKYGSRNNYIKSILRAGTDNRGVRYGSSGQEYPLPPILLDIPKIRNKIDMKTRVSKVSSLNLKLIKKHKFIEQLKGIELLNNCALLVYYAVPGSKNITTSMKVFTGYINNISQDKSSYTLQCHHISNYYNKIEIPQKTLPYDDTLPDKYKNQPYPMVYGEVDGAFAALEKVETDNSVVSKYLVFDDPTKSTHGFIDTDMPDGNTDTGQGSGINDPNYPDNYYKPTPEASQIYLGRGDNYLTLLKIMPWFLWGDIDEFSNADKFNMTYYRYTNKIQYNNYTNGIKVRTDKFNNPRFVNTIYNDVACVQFRDFFNGVNLNSHEFNVPNGFDASITPQDAETTNGYFVEGDNPDEPEIAWINSGDSYNVKEFFNSSDATFTNVPLHFKWWSTYKDSHLIDLGGGSQQRSYATEVFRGLRANFDSQLDGFDSYRIANMLHFKSRLSFGQWQRNGSNDESSSYAVYDVANEFNNGADVKPNKYPFNSAACSMNWFAGTFGEETADLEGNSPELYPGITSNDVPTIVHTRAYPYYPGNNYSGSLPRTYDGTDDVIKAEYAINSYDLEQNYWKYRNGLNPQHEQTQIMPDSQFFYNLNRKPWHVDENIDEHAHMPYDLYTHHGGLDSGGQTKQQWYQPPYAYNSNDTEFIEGGGHFLDGNDGFKWFPKTWGYSDSLETTMVMAPINKMRSGQVGEEGRDLTLHHYCELSIYELCMDRVFLVDEFTDSDFFAKVKGRKGYKELSGGSKQYIEKPNEIIYDILNSELGYGRKIVQDNDNFVNTSNEHASMKNGISLKERTETSNVIKKIVADSRVIVKNNDNGTINLDTIKKIYTDEDVDLIIKNQDVIKYKFKNTPLSDIKNQIKIDFDIKYLNGSYQKTSGIEVQGDGRDKYKIMVDGVLSRSTYFPGTSLNTQMTDYDSFTESMYGSLGIDDFTYSLDFYKLDEKSAMMSYSSDTVRDLVTASEVQKYLMLWHCNQHLIINLDLPITYFNLEVGDIVKFDDLIQKEKAFNYDYSKRYIKNGQVIYPYFMITSTNKSSKGVSVEMIQMHRLEWGLDGYAGSDYNLNWGQDDYTRNKDGIIPFEGPDLGTLNLEFYSNTGTNLTNNANDLIQIGFREAYASIDSYELTNIDSDVPINAWCNIANLYTNHETGEHLFDLESLQENYGGDRLGNLEINFSDGHTENITFTQRADEINITYYWYDPTVQSGTYNIESRTESGVYHSPGAKWFAENDTSRLWRDPIDENTYPDLYDDSWVVYLSENFPDYPTPAYGEVQLWVFDDNEFDLKTTGNIKVYGGHYQGEGVDYVESTFLEYWDDATEPSFEGDSGFVQRLVFKLAKRTRRLDNVGLETEDDFTYEEARNTRRAHVQFDMPDGRKYTANFNQVGTGWTLTQEGIVGGDINDDGQINVLDVVGVVNHILGGNQIDDINIDTDGDNVNDKLYNPGDINNDGIVNILDVVGLVNTILLAQTDEALQPQTYFTCEINGVINEGQEGDYVNQDYATDQEACEAFGGIYNEWTVLE